jgi:hypothetical protein
MINQRIDNKNWQLAQLNIAWLTAPIDSPPLESFVAQLDTINSLAEQSAGFVWRWVTDEPDPVFDEDIVVNLSVWQDADSLFNYTYKSAHTAVMRDRKKWFKPMAEESFVLWWVPVGHQPTTQEAYDRLQTLRKNGPSTEAFTFKNRFAMPS